MSLCGYNNVVITPEGYGSFLARCETSENCHNIAESLRANAESLNTRDCIPIYLEALYFYIKSLASVSNDVPGYASRHRRLCKFIDDILIQTRRFNMRFLKNILKWVLFNLKIQCLFREQDCLAKKKDLKSYSYVLNELKTMSILYNTKEFKHFNIVGIEELEGGIRRKLHENGNSYG